MNMVAPGVTLEAIKKAEDSEDLIVRIVERYGSRTKGKITFDSLLTKLAECDLMEQNNQPLKAEGNVLNFTINPYEIKTYRITF